MQKSIIKEKAYNFALTIIELYKRLTKINEYVISRQILKSGTSIGANVEEALAGQSRPDFLSKMSIASKEARETNYWLRLLRDGKFLDQEHIEKPMSESEEIIRLLTSIVKTTAKGNQN
jgi:four helix bundle protein